MRLIASFAAAALTLSACGGGGSAGSTNDANPQARNGTSSDSPDDLACNQPAVAELGSGSVCVDSKVRAEDLLQFANWAGNKYPSDDFGVSEMIALYGKENICVESAGDTCTVKPEADIRLDTLNTSLTGGRCEGMTTLGALYMISRGPDLDQFDAAAVTELSPRNENLVNIIDYWWSSQYMSDAVNYAAQVRAGGISRVLSEVARGLGNGAGTTLGLYFNGIGHSLLPVALTKNADETFVIHVWDSNSPGQLAQVVVDPLGDTWTFDGAHPNPDEPAEVWRGNSGSIDATPLFSRTGTPDDQLTSSAKGTTVDVVAPESNRVSLTITTETGNVMSITPTGTTGLLDGASVTTGRDGATLTYSVSLPEGLGTLDLDSSISTDSESGSTARGDQAVGSITIAVPNGRTVQVAMPPTMSSDTISISLDTGDGGEQSSVTGAPVFTVESSQPVTVSTATSNVRIDVPIESRERLAVTTSAEGTTATIFTATGQTLSTTIDERSTASSVENVLINRTDTGDLTSSRTAAVPIDVDTTIIDIIESTKSQLPTATPTTVVDDSGGTTTTTLPPPPDASALDALPAKDIIAGSNKSGLEPGQSVTLELSGFEPFERVVVSIQSDPVVLGTTNANSNGVARLSVELPSDLYGSHTLSMIAPRSQKGARMSVQIIQPNSTSTTTSIPRATTTTSTIPRTPTTTTTTTVPLPEPEIVNVSFDGVGSDSIRAVASVNAWGARAVLSFEVIDAITLRPVARRSAEVISGGTSPVERSVIIDGLTPARAYRIRAVLDATRQLVTSTSRSEYLDFQTVVPAPMNITVNPMVARLMVNWTAPPSAAGLAVTYTATASPSGRSCTVSGQTSCTISGLTNGVSYRVDVVATIGSFSSDSVVTATSFVPVTPIVTALSVTSIGTTSATISSGIDPRQQPITYRVTLVDAVGNGSRSVITDTEVAAGSPPIQLAIPLTGLVAATRYVATVSMTLDDGSTVVRTTTFDTIPSPIDTTPEVVPGDGTFDVSWNTVPTQAGAIVTYTATAEWQYSGGETPPTVRTVSCTTTSSRCLITPVANSRSFSITVVASTTGGSGAASPARRDQRANGPSAVRAVSVSHMYGSVWRFVWTIDCSNPGAGFASAWWRPVGSTGTGVSWGEHAHWYRVADLCWQESGTRTMNEIVDLGSFTPTTMFEYRVNSMYYGIGQWEFTPDSFTNTLNFKTPPSQPTNVTVSNVDGAKLDVAWTASSVTNGATPLYTVTAQPGGSSCSTTTTSCRIESGLTAGTLYSLTVTATYDDESIESASVSGRALSNALTTEPSASISAGSSTASTVNLTVTVNPHRSQTTRTVELSTSPSMSNPTVISLATTSTGDGNEMISTAINSLNPGSKYYVRLIAENEAGRVVTAPIPVATKPGVPSNPIATSADSMITVGWTAVTSGSSGAIGYRITVIPRVGGSFSDTNALDPITTSLTSYGVTGLSNGVDYQIRVSAFTADAVGDPTSPVVVTPASGIPSVSILSTTKTTSSVTADLSFNPGGFAGTEVEIWYGTDPTLTTHSVQSFGSTTTGNSPITIALTGANLTPGTTYYLKAVARVPSTSVVRSSSIVEVQTTPPSVASAPTATVSSGRLDISWTPVAVGNGIDVTYRAIATWQYANGEPPPNPLSISCTTTTSACSISGLTNGKVYSVVVIASTVGGGVAAESPTLNDVRVNAPAVINAVSATHLGGTNWSFRWTVDCTNVGSGYASIWWRPLGTTGIGVNWGSHLNWYRLIDFCAQQSGTKVYDEVVSINDLTPATTYEYRVNSMWLNTTQQTTNWEFTPDSFTNVKRFTTTPAAATSVGAVSNVDGSVTVNFTAGSSNVNTSVAHQVDARDSSGDVVATCSADTTSCTFANSVLRATSTYTFVVRSSVPTNANSTVSTSSSSLVSAPLTVNPPRVASAPLVVSGSGTITATWSPVTVSSGLTVFYVATATWQNSNSESAPNPTSRSCTTAAVSCVITGLTNSRDYTVSVVAFINFVGAETSPSSGVVRPNGPANADATMALYLGAGLWRFTWTLDCTNVGQAYGSIWWRVAGSTGTGVNWGNHSNWYSLATACSLTTGTRTLTEDLDLSTVPTNTPVEYRVNQMYYDYAAATPDWSFTPDSSTTVLVLKTPPTAPTNPVATPVDGARMDVSWSASSATGNPTITYTATATPGGATCTTSSTSCRIESGLTSGITYSFVVSAKVGIGPANDSASVSRRALTYSNITAPSITLQSAFTSAIDHSRLQADVNPHGGVTTLTVEVADNSSMTGATTSSGGTVSEGITNVTTAVTASLPQAGSVYWVRVTATNEAGSTSTTAKRVFSLPTAPTGVTATGANASVYLRWNAVAPGSSGAVTYQVQVVPWVSGGYDPANALPLMSVASNSMTVSSLTNGVSYQFAVRAFTPDSSGDYSMSVNATPVAAQPFAEITSVVSDTTAATVTANVNPGGSAGTKVALYYATNSNFSEATIVPYGSVLTGTSDTAITFSLSGLSTATKYYFKLVATVEGTCAPNRTSTTINNVAFTVLSFTSTTACNWVIPEGVSNITMELIGGGGGGGGDAGGGGGGGQARAINVTSGIAPRDVVQVTVGSSGAGAGGWAGTGARGGTTSVRLNGANPWSDAVGGFGGNACNWNGSNCQSANVGGISGNSGATLATSGAGGRGYCYSSTGTGCAGASSPTNGLAGYTSAITGAVYGTGGNGGAVYGTGTTPANAGSGGGGGAAGHGAGANGRDGIVLITYPTYYATGFESSQSPIITNTTQPQQVGTPTLAPVYGGLAVSWSPSAGGEVVTYTVNATKDDSRGGYTTTLNSGSCTTTNTTCTINGLNNGTYYQVTVTAATPNSSAAASPSAALRPNGPSPMPITAITHTGGTSWSATWQFDCTSIGNNTAGFYYRAIGTSNWTPAQTWVMRDRCGGLTGVQTRSESLTINGLAAATRYEMRIVQITYATGGWVYNYDSYADTYAFNTAPSAATGLGANKAVNGDITVTWTPASVASGITLTDTVIVFDSTGNDTGVRCAPTSAGTCTIVHGTLFPDTYTFKVASTVNVGPIQGSLTPVLAGASNSIVVTA